MSMRIVGFDELDDLWQADEISARWQDDFDRFFAAWELPDLSDLRLDARLEDFGYIELHDMLK